METGKGFTILELLIVVSLLVVMGFVSVTSYFSAVSGMTRRSTRENTARLVQMAQQRAATDHIRTAVFFYNQLLRTHSADQNAYVVGHAVAIRAMGRFSAVMRHGETLCLVDEFADLDKGRKSVKLGTTNADQATIEAASGRDTIYCLTSSGTKVEVSQVRNYAISRERTFSGLYESFLCHPDAVLNDGSTVPPNAGRIPAYYFLLSGGYSGWHAGNEYFQEIASLTLPENYIYGTAIPPSLSQPIKNNPVDAVCFSSEGECMSGDGQVKISVCRTTGADGSIRATLTYMSDPVVEEEKE